MVTDKFRPSDVKEPDLKQVELAEKGQDVLKAAKKDIKFTSHTIKSGESLTEICQQYGIPLKALYAVNQHTLDPKIIEKGGKIAYGAPTYHVGDKLNIPSQADVPNAVKYFDSWTKQTVAKQHLERDEPKTPGQRPTEPGEKPRLQTQVMDETHLAAKRAAMMVKVALETQHIKFQAQHEGQGPVDDLVDWFKKSTGLEHSSDRIEKEYQQEQQMIKLLEKAATRPDLKQFENLYRQCTGKNFNPSDFSSGYKKPASLAFPDLHSDYETSQAGGRRVVNLAAAAGVASLSIIPGTAEVTIPLAARLAAGTALGAIGSGAADYANTGKTDNLKNSLTDGAIVGASIPIAATVGIATEGTVLATGGLTAEGTLATGATIAARAQGALRVGAGFAGGAAGGGAAGGMVEGSLTAKEDAAKGKFDAGHIAQKTGEGVVAGALIGGTMGTVVPGLRNVLRVGKSAPAEAAAPIAEETAAVAAPTETVSKVAPPIKELPKTSMPESPIETPKSSPQPDVSKGTAQQPVDVDLSKGATTQPDVAKTVPGEWSKGSTHNVPPKPNAADLNKGTTQDASKSTAQQPVDIPESKQQPDVLKTTSPSGNEIWQKKLDKLANDPLVKDVQPLELQNGWQGIQYQRKVGGRMVQEMYNPQDGSKIFSEEFKDGFGLSHKEVTTTSANGKEITNRFRLRETTHGQDWVPESNKWETYMNDLRRDRSITNLEELPTGNDWNRVRYKTADGEKIEIAIRETDGTHFQKREWTDYRGAHQREISTTNPDGHKVTHNFTLDHDNTWRPIRKPAEDVKPESAPQSAEESMSEQQPSEQYMTRVRDRAKQLIDDGNNWINAKLKSASADAEEILLVKGWRGVEYTDSNGVKTVESYRPTDGMTNTVKTYETDGIRYQETTVVPKNGQPMWYKQKQVETKASRFKRQDDPDSAPEYDWEIVDSTQHQNYRREQDAKFKIPTE